MAERFGSGDAEIIGDEGQAEDSVRFQQQCFLRHI